MTERERLIAVMHGQTPDRTPWYGDLSWWWSAQSAGGCLPERHTGEAGYLRMHRDAGVGIYLYAPFQWQWSYDDNIRVTETTGENGEQTISIIETEHGVLRSVSARLPESATSAIIEHYVKDLDDLHKVPLVFQSRQIAPAFDAWQAVDDSWGDAGLAFVLAPVCTSGLQTLITRWAGIETVTELAADYPDELADVIGAMEEADDPIFDLLCRGPGLCVEFPENLSGEVTGRGLLRRFVMPYWMRRIAQLHAAGKTVGIHNDGTLRASLPLLIEAGFDFVESATPAPVGDISIEAIREATEGRIIVFGGIPGAMFSPLTDDAQFRDFVQRVLAVFPRGSGFVLGVADQVPPDAPWERICMVRDIVDRFG